MYKRKDHPNNDYKSRRKPDGATSFRRLFLYCRKGARSRNLQFDLSFEEHTEMVKLNCHWCGEAPKRFNPYVGKTGKITNHGVTLENIERSWVLANGVDRLDNFKGYIKGNCVPCCFPCNQLKSALNHTEFLQKCLKIAEHHKYGTANNNSYTRAS